MATTVQLALVAVGSSMGIHGKVGGGMPSEESNPLPSAANGRLARASPHCELIVFDPNTACA
jgi:hypothetical protein